MTILDIMVLCHIHAIAEPFPRQGPGYAKAIEAFLRSRWIERDPDAASGYRTTAAGAYIVGLLKAVAP